MEINAGTYKRIREIARKDLEKEEGFYPNPESIAIYSLNMGEMLSKMNIGDYFQRIFNNRAEEDGSLVRRWIGLSTSELLTVDKYLRKIRELRNKIKGVLINTNEDVLRAFDTIAALMDAQNMEYDDEGKEETENLIDRARKNDMREDELTIMSMKLFYKICMGTNVYAQEIMLDRDHELIKLRIEHHKREVSRIEGIRLAIELDGKLRNN